MKKRLLSQKRLSQLVFSIGMILLYINVSWGQQTIGSFPYMDGGFEGQSTGTISTAANGSANVWTKSAAGSTSSIVADASLARTGSKYAIGNLATGGSNRGLQTPTGTPPTAASHVIQFYYRNQPAGNIQAGIFGANGGIQIASTVSGWNKGVFVITSLTTANYAYVGRQNPTTSFSYDVDDVVVYAGTAVDETAPTVLASNPIVSTITSSQQTISWDPSTDADFTGYMVVRGIADPATTPKVNGIYAVGNTVATGEQVVYLGNGTGFTDLGLAQNTTYFYRIYTVDKAFNYSANALSFNSTTTAPVVIATEPTVQVSGLTLGNVTGSTLDINWTEGDGTNSLVLVKAASAVDTDPTDGGIYTANLAFGSGTQIGTGNYAVYTGTDNSATITGLTRGTTYFVKVYTFNVNVAGSQNYLTTTPPASGSILNLPYQNTFTFNSTADGFTTVTRATAIQATESSRGTLKINSPAANRLTTIVGLNTSYARVDVTTNKYAHITLRNTTTNNNIQLVFGSTNFNPRQIITTSDGDYKTYDFDLSTLTGDQYPAIYISVKDTWSASGVYIPNDQVISSNSTYKNVTGINTANSPRADIIANAAAVPPLPQNWELVGIEGGLLDITNFVYIDSIVFDNVLPTIVSNGTGGGDWSTAATWAGGIAPGTNDNVTILGSDTVNSTGSGPICSNLTLAGTLNITGGKLTVKNTLVNNGTITIDNNANLVQTALANTNSGSGTATVKRNSNPLFRLDYTMWSSPVNGAQTLAQFSPNTSQSPNRFFIYDNSTTNLVYVNVAPTSTFTTGIGYLIRMPNTDPKTDYDAGLASLAYPGQFTGTLNNGTVTLSGLASDKYYSVGNPYPSTLDAAAFITANPGTLYFWRKTNGALGTAYAAYNSVGPVTTGSGETGTGSELPNGTIQVGQGFIAKTGVAATELVFTNAMRLGTASTQFFKTKQVAEKSRVWLNLTNTAGLFSQTLVGYVDGATLGVDNGIDGKYINDSAIALTSNINGEEYTIQGRPAFDATDVVALNFKTDVAGDYAIAIDHTDGLFATGQDIYLVDSKTGIETDLNAGSYTFAAASGVDNTRFSLKYQKTLKVDDAIFNENNVAVYAKNGSLYVNSGEMAINSIQVYDVQGRLLAERKGVKTTTAIIENLKANNQVFLVKVLGANNKVVTKKVVN